MMDIFYKFWTIIFFMVQIVNYELIKIIDVKFMMNIQTHVFNVIVIFNYKLMDLVT